MRTIEEIQADMRALLAAAEGRALTDDEAAQYENLETELSATNRTNAIRARQNAYDTPVTNPAPTPGLNAPVNAPKPDDGLEMAFRNYLITGVANADLTQSVNPTMAQGSSVGSEGGYLVPPGFLNKIVERMKAFGGIANVCDQLNTATGNNIEWPTINDTSNVAEVVPESTAPANQNGLVFGKTELRAYTYQTGGPSSAPIKLPRELLQDQQFDLEARLARLLGIRLARGRAAHLATGNGVGQPLGLVFGLTGIELNDDTAGVTYNDLVNFTHQVDPAYRESGQCRWVFNDSSLKTIQQIKDSNGDPMWRSMLSTMGDAPGTNTLLGYPITIDQGMPNITVANNTINWGAFGNIQEGYVLRNVRGIEVVVNPWSSANTREVEYTAWMRCDATQQNTAAYVALTGEQ